MASRLNRACGRDKEREEEKREKRDERGTLDQVAKRQKDCLGTQRPRGDKKQRYWHSHVI